MKPKHSSTAVWKAAAVVIAVVVAVSMAGGAQAAAQNQISVRDQDTSTGVITIDSVTAAQNGWVVVYKDPNFSTGDIVGYAAVQQGANTNVKVTLDARRIDPNNTGRTVMLPTLWVRLHADNGVNGLFEWGLRNLPYDDAPVVENGHDIVAEFGTWASQGTPSVSPAIPAALAPAPSARAASTANTINVTTQALNGGVMHVNSVNAGQDGWVVVYKNPNFTPGEIVGYAPVHQGMNTDVPITIDTQRVKDLPGLWIMLHADNGVPGLFEWGLRNLPYDDQPVSENSHPVVAGFAITDVPQ